MNKDNLKKAVAEDVKEKGIDLHKKEVDTLVDGVLEAIIRLTKESGKLTLHKFGNFEVRERAARKGRNPQTGEEIDIAASKVPAFKPAQNFKQEIK